MIELIYGQWYFSRPKLAEQILSAVLEGTGDPVAIVGERRIGKTSHLLKDVIPAARRRAFLPVYIDVWQHRADPLAAINYGLQEAIDDLEVPESKAGKRLATSVKKIAWGGASLELGDAPARRRPEEPMLLVDWLLKALIRLARQPILLILDEAQEFATSPNGDNIVAAIRSAITKSKGGVRVIFTGSSQDQLLALFSRSRAVLYEGASTMAFPHLGEDFVRFLAKRAKERLNRAIATLELNGVFERLHHQPRALIDLVLLFASSDAASLSELLDERVESQLTASEYDSLWSSLKPLHQTICIRIASGEDVASAEARRQYALSVGKADVSPGTINSALRALVDSHILTKLSGRRGRYRLDDPLFGEWIRRADVRTGAKNRPRC